MALLPLWEMIEEAFERLQLDPRSGYDFRTAKRSLDLLQKDWANRGLNLWTVERREYPIAIGQTSIVLDADVHDLMDAVIADMNEPRMDLAMLRTSITDMLTISFKQMKGRPTRYSVQRGPNVYTATIWPVPIVAMRMLVNQMTTLPPTTQFNGSPVIPERFEGAMISGLTFYLAQKKAPKRIAELRALYEDDFTRAANEDRDRSSIFIAPEIGRV
jgi:hypothetical protein